MPTVNAMELRKTLGVYARIVGVLESQLRALCNRGEVPYEMLGRARVLNLDDLAAVRAVCVARGYLPPAAAEAADAAG